MSPDEIPAWFAIPASIMLTATYLVIRAADHRKARAAG